MRAAIAQCRDLSRGIAKQHHALARDNKRRGTPGNHIAGKTQWHPKFGKFGKERFAHCGPIPRSGAHATAHGLSKRVVCVNTP